MLSRHNYRTPVFPNPENKRGGATFQKGPLSSNLDCTCALSRPARFTRLHGSLVELGDGSSWDTGVHFGDGIITFQEMLQLKAVLNGRRYFRQIWKGSIATHEVGHLVCEACQHTWSRMRRPTLQKLVGDITSKQIKHKSSRRERQKRKRRFCMTIAEHALKKLVA